MANGDLIALSCQKRDQTSNNESPVTEPQPIKNEDHNNTNDDMNEMEKITSEKLIDLMKIKKHLRSKAILIFSRVHALNQVHITSNGIEIRQRYIDNTESVTDELPIKKIERFFKIFGSAITSLSFNINENVAKNFVQLKCITMNMEKLKRLEVNVQRHHKTPVKRLHQKNMTEILVLNPQIEHLCLRFDFDMDFIGSINNNCPQLKSLSLTCDISKFYNFSGDKATFKNVRRFELAFSDYSQYQYDEKLLGNVPLEFKALDELWLDLNYGGFGDDFLDFIAHNQQLTKLVVSNLVYNRCFEGQFVEYANLLPNLTEAIIDGHSLLASDVIQFISRSKSLQTLELLDVVQCQCNLLHENFISEWEIGCSESRPLSEGSSIRCQDLLLKRTISMELDIF